MMLIDMMKRLLLMIAPKAVSKHVSKPVSKRGSKDRYRPERHYMRGPGPKTKERSPRPGEPDQAGA